MKNLQGISIWIFMLLLAVSGCKRSDTPFDGPDLQDLNGTFSMLEPFEVSKSSLGFGSGETAYFKARFSKLSDWTVTITGNTSGAKKIITGKSRVLDATTATWNGSTTEFPMFEPEACTAVLTVEGVTDSFSLPLSIESVKANPGFLVADFESGVNPKWVIFKQSGANMNFKIVTDNVAPQGNSYFNMAGTVDWDWLIGLIDFPATAYGTSTNFPLSSNPDNEYFNVLLYGVPGTNQTLVLFSFKEDENQNGTFEASTEDEYNVQIPVTWEGWKLVSVKYADLTYLVNGAPGTPKGNKLKNPEKLTKISMLHLADKTLGFASSKMDYLIFTNGGPLEP
ncbi:MAG: hypothetical protein K1X92_13315 [Bacteroidia bacterium]|nr:hypothetical protein [Bacteroidia bacterium]